MYRKNTSGQNLGFRLVSVSTGAAVTGATVSVKRVIDNGTYENATGTVTEKGGGLYNFAPSQADTNGNNISFLFTATGAVPEEKTIVTTAADPTDGARLGLTALPADPAVFTSIKTVTDHLATALELDGAVYRLTANALELAPTGGGSGGDSAAAIAGAVRAELSTELARMDASISSRATAASIPANFSTLVISAAGIVQSNVIQVNGQPAQSSTDPIAVNVVQVSGQNLATSKIPATLAATDVTGKIPASLAATDVTGKIPATLAATDVTGKIPASLAATDISGKIPATLAATDVTGKIAASLDSTDVTGKIPASIVATDVTGKIAATLNAADISGKIPASLAATDITGKIAATLNAADISGIVAANVTQVAGDALTGSAVPATIIPTGLDAISVADPGCPAQMNSLPRMIVATWRRFYKKSSLDGTSFKLFDDDGQTINTTQHTFDDGTTQTMEAAQ